MRSNTSSDSTLLEYISLSIVRNVGNACYEVREGHVVVILNLTRLGIDKDSLLKQLAGLLGKRDVTVSYSLQFSGFRSVWYYYQQALSAEALGSELDPAIWLYGYEDYELTDMIGRMHRGMPAMAFVPEGLLRLIRHDEKRDGMYVKTLQTYLECERNVAETSRRLYVHRNTFLYRLSRIEELLGMDLDDSDVRLTLQLALRMING